MAAETDPEPPGVTTLYSVQFDSERVCELDEGSPIVSVEKALIRRMGVARGRTSERPAVTAGLGIVLLVAGLILLLQLSFPGLATLLSVGGKVGRLAVVPLVLCGLGAVLVWLGSRKGVYVWIDVGTEVRRLRLAPQVDSEHVRSTLESVVKDLGYPIDLASVAHLEERTASSPPRTRAS